MPLRNGDSPLWKERKKEKKYIYTKDFSKVPDYFVQAFIIVVDSWKFRMLLLYILRDDWPIFMISGSNEQLQQQLEYTLLNPDCHSWWISKMQSGREDTLEERYAIKFCFKLGKNATKTHGMLQTAFQPSCMNQTSVFEWHKRFKEGRESVGDDERCGRNKEVRTLELIGQIKNFMDKDCRVSIETISAQFDVSVGTVHNYSRGTEDAEDLHEVCPKGAQRRSERKTSWQQEDGRADQFISRSSWCSGGLRWKLDLLLWPKDHKTVFPVKACWLSQTQSKSTHRPLMILFTNPSARAGYDTRSIFKRSLTGFNSEFSFS